VGDYALGRLAEIGRFVGWLRLVGLGAVMDG
jgi:hypothetical protein